MAIKLQKGKKYWVANVYSPNSMPFVNECSVIQYKEDLKNNEDWDQFSDDEVWVGRGNYNWRGIGGETFTKKELSKMTIGEMSDDDTCIAESEEQLIKALKTKINLTKVRNSLRSKMRRRQNNIARLQGEFLEMLKELSLLDKMTGRFKAK
jgi:hypothetical protein